ncbi:DUF6651 domain-containing protein [Acinetobacter brisouii]|uniref:DUF6651 domain-containing protein n=1 Tax=Acinetobacter brisouii TaxID=396323 RepID=UPI00124D6865|nr:DUF6651 domain-containing protein [Acinetobacter brisouii]
MPLWMQLLAQGGILQNPADGEGGDLGGSAPAGEQPKGEEPKGEEPKGEEKPKMTDAEAKLLKEVMKHKEAGRVAKDELAALKDKLGDLDLDMAKELIAKAKENETKQLEAKGDYERLKQRMAEEHQIEVDRLKGLISELEGKAKSSAREIGELTVGAKFNQSKYIGDELVLPPAKARALYGNHFEVENGEVVAYDKPQGAENRTPLVDAYGKALSFDDAMRKIIESDPEKDHLIKSKLKLGADSNSKEKKTANLKAKNMTGLDKIQAGLDELLKPKAK